MCENEGRIDNNNQQIAQIVIDCTKLIRRTGHEAAACERLSVLIVKGRRNNEVLVYLRQLNRADKGNLFPRLSGST
jgi:hypothetical protein